MKQSKRMLSVLLAIIMICSTFTIGAQAAKANIDSPAYGYDEVLEPVISSEQAARMILDEIEPLLADVDVDEDVAGLKITIKSVDTLLDTVHNLSDSSLVGFAKFIADLGDIEKLALAAGDVKDAAGNRCRRANSTSTDFEVLGAVLTFLDTNASYVAKFAYNGFDFGWLDGLGIFGNDDMAALNDVHGLVVTLVDKLLAGEDFEVDIATEYNTDKTLDGILQDFIDNKLVKLIVDLGANDDGTNEIAGYVGLENQLNEKGELVADVPTTTVFPSLTDGPEEDGHLGKLSLNNDSFYDFLIKIVKAAVRDILLPLGPDLIVDLAGEDVIQYVDIALPILEIDLTFPEGCTPKEKVDILLRYLFIGEGKGMFFKFKEAQSPTGATVKYLSFADEFWTMLTSILRTVLPMLPPLLGEDCPDFSKTDAELAALSEEEFFTYVLQAVLEKFVDGVDFASDCHSIRELASRTLIEVCKDLMPEKNFEEEFEAGIKTYDSDDCLTLGAYVIRYYLNGETTIQDTTSDANMNLTAMLNTAADWALDRFGSLFGYDKLKYANSSVWQKAFDTAFSLIPLTLFVGAAPQSVGGKLLYKPGIPNDAAGLENLIMDDIIGGVLEFNITVGDVNEVGITGINKILALIGRRDDSELNKPIPQFVMDLVARLINPLFGLPTESKATDQQALIIPYTYTSLDQLLYANHNTTTLSLTNTVYRLCDNIEFINKGTNSLFYAGCPFIAQIMGLWGSDSGKFRYPFIQEEAPADFNNGKLYNYDSLKALYELHDDSVYENLPYDDPEYRYFSMVDFKPFLYLDYKEARGDVADLVHAYEAGETDPSTFRSLATNAAYKLITVNRFLTEGFNWDKSEIDTSSNPLNENQYDVYGETVANNNQLAKVLVKAQANSVEQEEYSDGSKKYTDRSWSAYSRALAFATATNDEYLEAYSKKDSDGGLALRNLRQSKINTARKMLVDAMAMLKAWVPLADYSGLDFSIETAGYITSLRMYNSKAVQKALQAYTEAINLERDYDMDEQFVVDEKLTSLDEAIGNLNEALTDYLYLYADGAGQYVDENFSYIYGFEEGFGSQQVIEENGDFDTFMMGYYGMGMAADGSPLKLDVTSTSTGNGTGAVVKMYSYEDEEMLHPAAAKYTVIIFGDVDGDAYSNACDSTILRAYCQTKLTADQIGAPALYAADANESGAVDSRDAKEFESNGLMKTFANQAPDALTCQTFGIVDVLGLR